jgi:hypothetical protein
MARTASGADAAGVRPFGIELEPVIYREEALAVAFAVTDILAELRRIRRVLEDGDDGEEEEGV